MQAALEGLKAMQRQPGVVPKQLLLPELSVAASDGARTSGSVVPYEDRLNSLEARNGADGVAASRIGTADSSPPKKSIKADKRHGRAEAVRSTTEGMLEGNLQDLDAQVHTPESRKLCIAGITQLFNVPRSRR
jgi:hypothetical protein